MTATRSLLGILGCLLLASPALAGGLEVSTDVTCPASTSSGSSINLQVVLTNRECSSFDVRLLTSVVGNADQSLGGIGVFGPKVAAGSVTVPAAIDLLPGTCDLMTNMCNGSSIYFCGQDSDCVCREIVPGSTNVFVSSPIAAPMALEGTVATYLTVAEWGNNEDTQIQECLVEIVP